VKSGKKHFELYLYIILGLVIAGASALTGGSFSEKKSYSPSEFYQIDISQIPSNNLANSTIQLHALQFKKLPVNITPTPSFFPTSTPVIPTAIPIPCTQTLALNLLLDKSGSMGNKTPSGVPKIQRLK